ncbi:MAG: hypothetical protein ABGW49_06000 [Nitrosopumilus sp.]|jgi:hypothetical protein
MEDSQIVSFAMWSIVTGIIMLVSGFGYRAYLKKKSNSISSS